MKLIFEGDDFDAIQQQMIDMLNGLGRPPIPVNDTGWQDPAPRQNHTGAQNVQPESHEHTHGNGPTGQVDRSGHLSVDDLLKSMKLKPTQTSTLGDGTTVKNGDHVACNGEEWVVYQTYRGRLVAATEDNKADVLDAGACSAPSQRTQQSAPPAEQPQQTGAEGHPAEQPQQPRPGTAAALLGPQTNGQGERIAPADASALRDRLTTIVASGKLSPEKVFEVLSRFGAQTVDALTTQTKAQFETSINAELGEQPASPPPGQFGF